MYCTQLMQNCYEYLVHVCPLNASEFKPAASFMILLCRNLEAFAIFLKLHFLQ